MTGICIDKSRNAASADNNPIDHRGNAIYRKSVYPHGSLKTDIPHQYLLELILGYELRCAARYRRFTAIVKIASTRNNANPFRCITDGIRGSDKCFLEDGTAIILMGETDTSGALVAIERFRAMNKDDSDLRFAVVSYPSDARDVSEMLIELQRRIDAAMSLEEAGGIVYSRIKPEAADRG